MRQYETFELIIQAPKPQDSWVEPDIYCDFSDGDQTTRAMGFYAGDDTYKIRFLPQKAGQYSCRLGGKTAEKGTLADMPATGELTCYPADSDHHGMVRAEGTHFIYQDGTPYYPFGTTVYAMIHQEDELLEQTFRTLETAPFNKIRICVFPKHFRYNENEPKLYPFERTENGWNTDRPCMEFWDRLENTIVRLEKTGIQTDLILFHPYDYGTWGFDEMSMEDNRKYLEYLMRRLSAFPSVWWSLANEYDAFRNRSRQDFELLEEMAAGRDAYGHLFSNHNILTLWDASRPNITHVSAQTMQLSRIFEWQKKYGTPVIIDECCYEGNIPEGWGAISGREMTRRFWLACATGGYCTHGETFLDPGKDVLWWAKGGVLKGESPARIAFLREIIESLPGPLEQKLVRNAEKRELFRKYQITRETLPQYVAAEDLFYYERLLAMGEGELTAFLATDMNYYGHCGEEAYLYYYDLKTSAVEWIDLPETHTYRVEILDTWEMTRRVATEHVNGRVEIRLPGKEGMAVLAVAEDPTGLRNLKIPKEYPGRILGEV